MSRSILIPMIRSYLEVCGGYHHREYVVKEADRIAAKIRETFGPVDESSQELCATLIRVVMKHRSKPNMQSKPTRKLNIDRWVKGVLGEAKAREERDARLRAWLGS
jgi:hypothetical protein